MGLRPFDFQRAGLLPPEAIASMAHGVLAALPWLPL